MKWFSVSGFIQLIEIKGVYLSLVILSQTWNIGMMEYWKVEDPVFSGIGL